jgi:hypothetical protein
MLRAVASGSTPKISFQKGKTMPKLQTDKSRQAFEEIFKFANQQAMTDALKRAGKDRQLLRKAKRDPKAFLRGEGLRLPPRVDVTISERRIGIGVGRLCVTVCQRVGPFVICVTRCIPIIIIVVSG